MRLGLVAIALLLFATTACPQKQEQRTYVTHADGNVPLIPTSHSELPQLPGIRISWYHGSTKKLVMLRLDNVSGKNINAYNISIRLKFTDGSTNPFCTDGRPCFPGEHMEVFALVGINGMEPRSFVAGTSRDDMLYQGDQEVSDVEAVPDMIVYTDDTAEVKNERAFKQIMAMRKGDVMAMQKVNQVIKQVLADPTVESPISAARTELTGLVLAGVGRQHIPEEPEGNEEMGLRNAITNLSNAPQAAKFSKQSEREYLTKYVEEQDARIAAMAPHCEVKRLD
jgi:hypothetical protein